MVKTEESVLEQLGLKEEYKFVKNVGNKLIYAHTVYYEIDEPDYEQFITEDDTPVENIFSEVQQRFLINTLFGSVWTDRDFWASSNVGIYYAVDKPCVVPDMFLSFDVKKPDDLTIKKNKCYFTWVVGKVPELVVEIISNKIGNEDTSKKNIYATMGVKYYVLIDPYFSLSPSRLKVFSLEKGKYEEITTTEKHYFMPEVDLGIMIWEGLFEQEKSSWARWCSKEGDILVTGVENDALLNGQLNEKELLLQEEKQRADEEKQRADEEKQRADEKELLLQEEKQRADENQERIEKLLAQLEKMGLTPQT